MEMTVYFDPPIDDPNDIPKVLERHGEEYEVIDCVERVSRGTVSDVCFGGGNSLMVSGSVYHGWVLKVRPVGGKIEEEIIAE